MRERQLPQVSLDPYEAVVGQERMDRLRAAARDARRLLDGRTVWNVNSTGGGGGVAELLEAVLPLACALGVEVRWLVMSGDPELFVITKRLGNNLYGVAGDGGPLGAAERERYRRASDANATTLASLVRPGDVVLLHDFQTVGLVEHARRCGATVVWRCHVGSDGPNEHNARAWEFLRPWLDGAHAMVFSTRRHVPGWVRGRQVRVIAPSIHPFAPKNLPLDAPTVRAVLLRAGLLDGDPPPLVRVPDEHGGHGDIVVRRQASVIRDGPPPAPEAPLVVQVSRWDRLKDMQGVMQAFLAAPGAGDAHLALVGPVVDGVADDPEGRQMLEACRAAFEALPAGQRARVQLVCLPMDDLRENATMVNALQRHAAVVVQKSLAEGFGLTVTEAMWKGRPVVASAVGGIREQIVDGEHGLLLDDPLDLDGAARAVGRVLADPQLAERLGRQARARVQERFLPDRHLLDYADLLGELLGPADGEPP